jgi:hypothetical protein
MLKSVLTNWFFSTHIKRNFGGHYTNSNKVQDMKMAKWNLSKEVWIRPLNLGTHDKPQVVKLNVDLDLFIAYATKQLLKEYVFVWM